MAGRTASQRQGSRKTAELPRESPPATSVLPEAPRHRPHGAAQIDMAATLDRPDNHKGHWVQYLAHSSPSASESTCSLSVPKTETQGDEDGELLRAENVLIQPCLSVQVFIICTLVHSFMQP